MTGTEFACWQCGAGPDGIALYRVNRPGKTGIWACRQHTDRAKCSIEGCNRSTKREGGGPWEWICSVHWRRHCPPRSRRRRAYLAFFRKAKRQGWDQMLDEQYWRFWDTLVRVANAAESAGTIDTSQINKMFGWNDE